MQVRPGDPSRATHSSTEAPSQEVWDTQKGCWETLNIELLVKRMLGYGSPKSPHGDGTLREQGLRETRVAGLQWKDVVLLLLARLTLHILTAATSLLDLTPSSRGFPVTPFSIRD